MAKEKKSSARKTSKVPTKIMTFGACPASEADASTLREQVFLAHRYRQKLIGIELERRAAFRALRRTLSTELNELENKVDALESRIKDERKGLKKKNLRDTPEQLERIERIRELRAGKHLLYPQIAAEHERIRVTFFDAADKEFREQKEARFKAAAAHAGRTSLGPNCKLRRDAEEALYQHMFQGSWPEAWMKKARIDRQAHQALIAARKNCGCNPGTYQKVEEAVKRAKDDAQKDPRQKNFDHTGMVAIQLTQNKGMPVTRALNGSDKRLRIKLRPDIRIRKNRFARRELGTAPYRQAAEISCLIAGTAKNGVYVNMNVVLHRPLPEDGTIKWFQVYVDRIGYKPVYECQFVLESETFRRQDGPKNDKHLAVNLGWRVTPNGIRIATTWDGERSDEVLINGKLFDDYKYAASLLGFSDQHFDVARDTLVTWLKEANEAQAAFPVLLKAMPRHRQEDLGTIEKIATDVGRWRSHEKLRRVARALKESYLTRDQVDELWRAWVKERKAERKDLYCGELPSEIRGVFEDLSRWFKKRGVRDSISLLTLCLEWWVRKDEHLVNWARNTEDHLRNQRRDYYRKLAANWALSYETVTIEKWDKSVTAQLPEAENDKRTPQEEKANTNRQRVGISLLAMALKEVLGDRLQEVSARDISIEHRCDGGGKATTRLSPTQLLTCTHCKRAYDQDLNAALHLWDRRERSGEPSSPGTARKAKSQENTSVAAE